MQTLGELNVLTLFFRSVNACNLLQLVHKCNFTYLIGPGFVFFFVFFFFVLQHLLGDSAKVSGVGKVNKWDEMQFIMS